MNFDGASTIPLSLTKTTDLDVKAALNDLPTLYPNFVTYVNSYLLGSDKIMIVKFSTEIGWILFKTSYLYLYVYKFFF